jgi:hypothetical protein
MADKLVHQVKRHREKTASRRLRAPSAGEVLSKAESET